MKHKAIEHVLQRAENAKSESDYTHFSALLLVAEALAKTMTLGMVASILDDKDRHRYRLEHKLVRADGLGDWERIIEDAVTGPASQYLCTEAYVEQRELMQHCKAGTWQYDAVSLVKKALDDLGLGSDEVPTKTDMKRWFRLLSTLRNGTRGHGATLPAKAASVVPLLEKSINLIYSNFHLFKRSWAHLYRSLSGKYRVSPITDCAPEFDFLKKVQDRQFPDGIYIAMESNLRGISLLLTDPDLRDFFYINGKFMPKTYEMLSYTTDDRIDGNSSQYLTPPDALPQSETHGHKELVVQGKCFSNAPDLISDYINRPRLEEELKSLLLDDKRPIVTLRGRGGIGKTSLALKVIQGIHNELRYDAIVWLSARDVDLHPSGPKPVAPSVFTQEDISKYYASLVLSNDEYTAKGFKAKSYFEQQLQKSDIGTTLFVFDNFETTQNPLEMFKWIDCFIKLPNKALITTRLHDFKGDYPVDVSGMEENEARCLISKTAETLHIANLLEEDYINELIDKSEGHPYVIRILLGEVARQKQARNIPRIIAGTEDILVALFERTYDALSPCAQRAFLTLSAWNSPVPHLALEAVLYLSTNERNEVEKGIESLIQYSMAEILRPPNNQEEKFIGLPLVASAFGKTKLAISPFKAKIRSDAEILQMFGVSRRDDVRLGLATRIENFASNLARQIERGKASRDSYAPVMDLMCRAYNPARLILARWNVEDRTEQGYQCAKELLRGFLANNPPSKQAAEGWKMLGHACYKTGDTLGEIHAYIESAQILDASFYDLSSIANRLNGFLNAHGLSVDKETKRELASRVLTLLDKRRNEASPTDLSRMAWLAYHLGLETQAKEYVAQGLQDDPGNEHLRKLANR